MEDVFYLIKNELSFYLTYELFILELHDEFEELQAEVSWPITYGNEIDELIRCQVSVEEQVIARFERDEIFKSKLRRAKRRYERFEKALDTLGSQEKLRFLNIRPIPARLVNKVFEAMEVDYENLDKALRREYKREMKLIEHLKDINNSTESEDQKDCIQSFEKL